MRFAHGMSLLAVAFMANVALAQAVRQVEQPARRAPAEGTVRQSIADQQLAAVIHNCSHNEVELAKFAKDKIKNDDVKEFAAMMIKDHQEGCEKFKKWAGQLALASSDDANRRDARRAERAQRVAAMQPLDWVAMTKEIGDECLASTKEELGRYEGSSFDKAFLGQQVAAHLKMVDELKVFSEYATGSLKQEIELATKTTEDHLKQARKLMDDIKDEK